uniref:Si:ch73-54n14.2 n=1 Tax=Sinocyclocheilus rhinocerous TaxID=307959 RepID=A0A673KLA7_9TELE
GCSTYGCVSVVESYAFLTMQVLKQKQLDSADVQQVSVRRFSSFNLFSRSRVTPTETDEPSEGQWVEYRSAIFPQYSALLRDNLGPIRVDEVLSSFDNTGNVCEYPFYACPYWSNGY